MKSVKEKAREYAATVPACFGDASEIAYAAYMEGGRDVFSRLSSNHFQGYADGRKDAERELVYKNININGLNIGDLSEESKKLAGNNLIRLNKIFPLILGWILSMSIPAYAQYQPYVPPVPRRDNGTVGQMGQYPKPGNIYVPVPSTVYEIGKGYVPSVGLAEVPGKQLNSPLGTSLGYDAQPVAPVQPQYNNPFIFSGK